MKQKLELKINKSYLTAVQDLFRILNDYGVDGAFDFGFYQGGWCILETKSYIDDKKECGIEIAFLKTVFFQKLRLIEGDI